MGEAEVGAARREEIRRRFAEQTLNHALNGVTLNHALNGVTLALEGFGFELSGGPIIARSEHFEITIRQIEAEPKSNIITPAQFGGR